MPIFINAHHAINNSSNSPRNSSTENNCATNTTTTTATTTAPAAMMLKFFYGDDKRRLQASSPLSFDALVSKAREMYGIPFAQPLRLRAGAGRDYADADEVASAEDWQEVLTTARPDTPVRVWIGSAPGDREAAQASGTLHQQHPGFAGFAGPPRHRGPRHGLHPHGFGGPGFGGPGFGGPGFGGHRGGRQHRRGGPGGHRQWLQEMQEERELLEQETAGLLEQETAGLTNPSTTAVATATVSEDAAKATDVSVTMPSGHEAGGKEQQRQLKAAEREIKKLKKQLARRDITAAKDSLADAIRARQSAREVVMAARQQWMEAKAELQDRREAVDNARAIVLQLRGEAKSTNTNTNTNTNAGTNDTHDAVSVVDANATTTTDSSSESSSAEEDGAYILVSPPEDALEAMACVDDGRSRRRGRHGQHGQHGRRATNNREERLLLAQDKPVMSEGHIVVLRSAASGKTLRILRNGEVNGRGGSGALARFQIAGREGDRLQLRSARDAGLYLGITPETYQLAGTAADSPFAWFRLVEHDDGFISLRSDIMEKPAGVGILPDGTAKPADQTGTGAHGRFVVELVGIGGPADAEVAATTAATTLARM